MTPEEFDHELTRMFLAFSAGIAFFLLLFLGRVLRVFFVGRRYRGVVSRVRTSMYRRQKQFSYDVRYEDPIRGHLIARERQEVPIREFDVGDAVTVFVKDGDPPACEILSWKRLLLSLLVILLISLSMLAAYRYFLGGETP